MVQDGYKGKAVEDTAGPSEYGRALVGADVWAVPS